MSDRLAYGSNLIGGGSGGGGHTIEGASCTALSQEPTLQFADADATDDAVNEKTVVNVVRERTQAEYDDMSAADQAKGIINITDANAKPLFASQVRYGDGTVEDALDEIPITITEASGCTITNLIAYKCGRFTKICGRATFDNPVNNGSSANIGSIPVEFAPQDTVVSIAMNGYDLGVVYVNSSGTIAFRHIVGSAVWRDNAFAFIY